MSINLLENYFFSVFSWIANLGVVPLFRFAVFLTFPPLFLLRDLLDSVTFEFETIFNSLSSIYHRKYLKFIASCEFLYIKTHSVKILIALTGLIYMIFPQTTLCAADLSRQIVISIGQHHELNLGKIKKFTFANPTIVSHKYIDKSGILLIKGKKLGFTELLIWNKNKKKEKFSIYILSKKQHLKLAYLVNIFSTMGLTSQINGNLIISKGVISKLSDYLLLKQLITQYNNKLHLEILLSSNLKKILLGKIYKHFYDEYIDNVQCNFENINIFCKYSNNYKMSTTTKKYLKKNLFVNLMPIKQYSEEANFLAKLQLIKIERSDGREFSIGLDQVSSSLISILTGNNIHLLNQERIIFKDQHFKLETIARPETVLRLGHDAHLSIGDSIPYTSSSPNGQGSITSWKFAGIKIHLKLFKYAKKYVVQYSTEFTNPSDNKKRISGSLESSSISVDLEKPYVLFQIGYKANAKSSKKIPFLGDIPFLGELFSSTTLNDNYKKITGILYLQEL